MTRPLHLRATVLPYGDAPVDLWVRDGRITFAPQDGADPFADGGYVLPGLVDAHVHLTVRWTAAGSGVVGVDGVRAHLRAHAAAGVLLVRDIGASNDATREFTPAPGEPRAQLAGRFLAPADGGFPGSMQATPAEGLVEAAVAQARAGTRWVKFLGDWFRGEGFAPNYPPEILAEAVRAANDAGARTAVHAFTREVAEASIAGGVHTLEHGLELDEGLIDRLAAGGSAWTPTVSTMIPDPDLVPADAPPLARHMAGRARVLPGLLRYALSAGVTLLAGTDALPHGAVWQEVAALARHGLTPDEAIATATTAARAFLGEPSLEEGAPADLVVYEADPRSDPAILARPARALLGGARVPVG